MIADVSLDMSVRTNQAHFKNPKSTFINRQSIRRWWQFENLTHSQQVWDFKDSSEEFKGIELARCGGVHRGQPRSSDPEPRRPL